METWCKKAKAQGVQFLVFQKQISAAISKVSISDYVSVPCTFLRSISGRQNSSTIGRTSNRISRLKEKRWLLKRSLISSPSSPDFRSRSNGVTAVGCLLTTVMRISISAAALLSMHWDMDIRGCLKL
jgi:hypothetical protein